MEEGEVDVLKQELGEERVIMEEGEVDVLKQELEEDRDAQTSLEEDQ